MTTLHERSEVRDGMHIDWNVPIEMDDGLVLRADVFRPIKESRYPVILTYGPYAKNLSFQEGYPTAWQTMESKHPDVTAGSSNLYQNWKWWTRRSGCRTIMPACASIHAAPAVRPAFSTISRRARRRIITTASNGPARSTGPPARSALTASPTTA
jgi:hypothetical protein